MQRERSFRAMGCVILSDRIDNILNDRAGTGPVREAEEVRIPDIVPRHRLLLL